VKGRGIDDHVGPGLIDDGIDCVTRTDVQDFPVGSVDIVMDIVTPDIAAELAGLADEKNLHIYSVNRSVVKNLYFA
jgi:hypothetical protein